MTREELRRRVLRALYDDPEAPVFWQIDEINRLIDEAQEFLAEEVEALTRTWVIPRRPGAMLYNLRGLSEQVMRPYRLWSPERAIRLQHISIRELSSAEPRWLETRGSPEYWFTVSWETFGIWPVPSEGGGVHQVECLIWPDPLTADTYELPWSLATQDALQPYVMCEAALKEHDAGRAADYERQALATSLTRRGKEGVNRLQSGPWRREP